VSCMECPKSIITAQSLHYLEQFGFWKHFGGKDVWSMEAKCADAFVVLEQALRQEDQDGKED